MRNIIHSPTSKSGFTLVEFMLYIAITSIVLTVAGGTILNILFGKSKLSAIEEVSQNARFALHKITDTIAESVEIASPAQSATSSALSLFMSELSKNPTVFHVTDGVLYMTEGTAPSSRLISSSVEVALLEFWNISSANAPGAVKIRMKIRAANPDRRPEHDFEQTFYVASNIRKN